MSLYSQCQPAVVEDIFPGWQWRAVNPVTKKEEEEFQPFNTTLPACSKYASSVILSFMFIYVICSIIHINKRHYLLLRRRPLIGRNVYC